VSSGKSPGIHLLYRRDARKLKAQWIDMADNLGVSPIEVYCLGVRRGLLHRISWITLLVLGLGTGSPAQQLQFNLRDVDGVQHRQSEWTDKHAIVIYFTTVDCPLSNGYVPEMNRIQKEYAARGLAFYAVEADTTIADAEVRRHAKEFGFTYPVLLDKGQSLVRLTGATAAPEVAVLTNTGKVLYLGRIDNRVVDFDKRRNVVTKHDLKEALEAVLAGRPVPNPRTKVVGCAITLAPNFQTEKNKR
jgi:thiol-disulfide isomerase/thioredoxin